MSTPRDIRYLVAFLALVVLAGTSCDLPCQLNRFLVDPEPRPAEYRPKDGFEVIMNIPPWMTYEDLSGSYQKFPFNMFTHVVVGNFDPYVQDQKSFAKDSLFFKLDSLLGLKEKGVRKLLLANLTDGAHANVSSSSSLNNVLTDSLFDGFVVDFFEGDKAGVNSLIDWSYNNYKSVHILLDLDSKKWLQIVDSQLVNDNRWLGYIVRSYPSDIWQLGVGDSRQHIVDMDGLRATLDTLKNLGVSYSQISIELPMFVPAVSNLFGDTLLSLRQVLKENRGLSRYADGRDEDGLATFTVMKGDTASYYTLDSVFFDDFFRWVDREHLGGVSFFGLSYFEEVPGQYELEESSKNSGGFKDFKKCLRRIGPSFLKKLKQLKATIKKWTKGKGYDPKQEGEERMEPTHIWSNLVDHLEKGPVDWGFVLFFPWLLASFTVLCLGPFVFTDSQNYHVARWKWILRILLMGIAVWLFFENRILGLLFWMIFNHYSFRGWHFMKMLKEDFACTSIFFQAIGAIFKGRSPDFSKCKMIENLNKIGNREFWKTLFRGEEMIPIERPALWRSFIALLILIVWVGIAVLLPDHEFAFVIYILLGTYHLVFLKKKMEANNLLLKEIATEIPPK